MEPLGTLFGVFRFSFPFLEEKKQKTLTGNGWKYRRIPNLEFGIFGFLFFQKFEVFTCGWCIKSRSIPSDLDRSSKINFSFSLNSPFQCSVSWILYGKNRKYRSQPYKNSIALESTLNKSPGLNEKRENPPMSIRDFGLHVPPPVKLSFARSVVQRKGSRIHGYWQHNWIICEIPWRPPRHNRAIILETTTSRRGTHV